VALEGGLFVPTCRELCDPLDEVSPIPEHSLCPSQLLDWNISLRVARDIELAKERLDK